MRGSIWPNFGQILPGKIWPNRAAQAPSPYDSSKNSCFQNTNRKLHPPKISLTYVFKAQMRAARFGQICPASHRAKLGQIGLLFVRDEKCAARFGQILPGSLRAKFGQIGLLFVRDEKCAVRFGQILPGGCPATVGQIEPRISHRVRRAARFGQILPGACPAKFGPRLSGGPTLFKGEGVGWPPPFSDVKTRKYKI